MKPALLLPLAVLLLAGCELGYGPEGEPAQIGMLVVDDPTPLGTDRDRLFQIRYCAQDDGPTFLVSELHTELEAQGMHWKSGYNFRYQLTTDLDHDHRFGPGDVVTVSEQEWEELGESDVGRTYKVSLYRTPDLGMDELLGAADWQAR